MKHRAFLLSILWASGAFLLAASFYGCAGSTVAIGRDAPDRRHERVERHGPPPWAPAHGYRAKHRYRYYPSCQVYYDEGRGVYFYMRQGGWQVSVSLPSHLRLQARDYVTLEMDTDRPYRYHRDVVDRYPPGLEKKKSGRKDKRGWD
ncbi:MAG: hypothetical protein ACLFUE_09235 [Desulfobacteraceae bacterium]